MVLLITKSSYMAYNGSGRTDAELIAIRLAYFVIECKSVCIDTVFNDNCWVRAKEPFCRKGGASKVVGGDPSGNTSLQQMKKFVVKTF